MPSLVLVRRVMVKTENARKRHNGASASVSADSQGRDAFLVHCRSLNGLPSYLALRGVDYTSLAAQAGLGDADASSTDSFIALNAFAHLLEMASEAADDDCLGLRWTGQDDQGARGTLALSLRYVPTLRTGLETLVKFMPLHVDVASAEVRFDGNATLSWRYSPLILRQDQVTDRTACLFVSWLNAALPRTEFPVEVRLARRKPKSSALHRALLASNIQFDANQNEIVFSQRCLDLPNPRADGDLFRALCDLNSRLVCERKRQDDIVLKVREEIMDIARQDERPATLDVVARQMGLSARGLQRRLAGCGTSFNDLVDGLRRESAQRLLEESDLMISEIAYRLGFSSIGNFTRAAKRWFGRSPRDYRSHLQSSRAPK
ncbi:AraC family transcriptional regulator ligand-binding domain-containing protein [Breoghania sp.]|uniref:AraC family transcriptional regulator n=1 Tax=Breoghania sp. TaxID=2065378 RepID=UPI0029CA6822|nr:AraC family transcriptional regulator ligand-binding domain-containing protein [Breoghania sp.]